jgi:hypothetical protein
LLYENAPVHFPRMLTVYFSNFVGKADGLIGLGHSLASLGNPCATPKLLLITVSISFEKFPDKTMLCGVFPLRNSRCVVDGQIIVLYKF